MTPEAPAPKILCDKLCGKVYKSRTRMLTHVKAVHKDTSSERTSLDSPVRLALFQIREGEDADANQSTQGNSHGQINSPKVVSEGRFVCSTCDKNYPKKDEVLKHIADDHGTVAETMEDAEEDLSGDEEVLEEACELYEALEAMTMELYEDDADESKKDYQKVRKVYDFSKEENADPKGH